MRCAGADVAPAFVLDPSDVGSDEVVSELEEVEETLLLAVRGGETGAGRGGRPCCVRTRMYASVA